MTTEAFPCPFLIGEELCSKTCGHRGRHEPGAPPNEVPEISARRLARIRATFFDRRWWQRPPRCPRCRTLIDSLSLGEPVGPVLAATYGDDGPCVVWLSEYPVSFGPCGHQFRRVMRPGDFR